MMKNYCTLTPQKSLALLVSFGIGLDNAINTFYFLNLEQWHLFLLCAATVSSLLLNSLLYWLGAEQIIVESYKKLTSTLCRKNLSISNKQPYKWRSFIHESIAIGSALTMFGFTLHSYQDSPINCPYSIVLLFSLCYFLGTYTLILQACKRPLWIKIKKLSKEQCIYFTVLWSIFTLATLAAGCQWFSGMNHVLAALGNVGIVTTSICWLLLMIGEAIFIAQVALWLVLHHPKIFDKYTHSVKTKAIASRYINHKTLWQFLLLVSSIFNAIGFAGMTHFDSWMTTLLSGHTTFALGFIMSFLIMIKSIGELYLQSNHHQSKMA